MCRHNQIAMLDPHVIDRCNRETALHACPAGPVIRTDKDPCFSSHKQQTFPHCIDADHTGDFILRETVRNAGPACPAIAADKQIGMIVGRFVTGC